MSLSPSQAKRLGADAFVFGFPLMLTATTIRQAAADADRAPLNRFAHVSRFPDPGFRTIVGAHAHTLYSLAWLDLAGEPTRLQLPDAGGRTYLILLLDAWSCVFASFGPRTGNGADDETYAIAGPGWAGKLPGAVSRLDAPTNNAWAIFHLHGDGRDDLEAGRELQQRFLLSPLSAETAEEPSADELDPVLDALPAPHRQVMEMDAQRFLTELAAQMGPNPPAQSDAPLLERLASIGLQPGEPFDWGTLPAATRVALAAGLEEGKEAVSALPEPQTENGWQAIHAGIRSNETDYLRRARLANLGLGITHPEDALFPLSSTDGDGQQLNGSHDYVLRFEPDSLPPVELWSLALYDMDQLLVDNPIDRYALGNRDELEIGPDGSLEIAIQHEPPEGSLANWLPAPEGDFNLMLHMYWPGPQVLNGSWTIPPVKRVLSSSKSSAVSEPDPI